MQRINKRWVIRDRIPKEIDDALAVTSYPSFFRQILYARGVETLQQAHAYVDCVLERDDPFDLTDMEPAIDRMRWAIKRQEQVIVYGDYDVDGVTATALLTQVLRRLGARVTPYIPNRFDEGYGLNVDALDALAAGGAQLIITVDCGIRSPVEAERAKALDIDLIISDHHHPGELLPDAFAVISPRRPNDAYPDKNLSGAGLAYKIAQALVRRIPSCGFSADDWLDLVALGTVADVVPLKEENRVLVRRGLQCMQLGARLGLRSLAGVAGIKNMKVTAGDIGFILGPRLNAAGRMETAMDSLNLLMTDDPMQAGRLAQQLDNQNRQRQEMTRRMQEEALRLAQQVGCEEMLFAFSPGFSSGIVGLAASRLVDAYYRPAMVGEVGEVFTRASCRSIPEFHITRALDECADLLERHGGHAVAAGLTIRNDRVQELIRRLGQIAARELGGLELRPVLRADLEIALVDLRPELLSFLDKLQPTGEANAEAVFVSRGLRVIKHRTVGSEGQHLRLTLSDGRITYDGIAFRQGHHAANMPARVDVMFVFERNEFNGQVSLQLNIRDLKPSGTPD